MSARRKASDKDIIRLNSMGLSLRTIGRMLGIHKSTVGNRLTELGIEAADTRRAFMEDVWNMLSTAQRDWLAEEIPTGIDMRDFVRSLLVERHMASRVRSDT